MTYRELLEKIEAMGKMDEEVIVDHPIYGEYHTKLEIGEIQVEVGEFKPAIVI